MSLKQSPLQKFSRWFYGDDDPFTDTMPMKEQPEYKINKQTEKDREQEMEMLREKIYDEARNPMLRLFQSIYRIMGIVCCISIIFLLITAVSYLPQTGHAGNPDDNAVSRVYLENGIQDTGAVNSVAGMILSYRAFDTFGETNVLFVATCCVMILLMISEERLHTSEIGNDRFYEPKNDLILQKAAWVLVPVIFLFGICIMFNGHLSPGGGFSGGAVLGAGLILYVAAFGFEKTERFFNETIYRIIKVGALTLYGLMITYYFVMGANGLENHIPLGIPGNLLSAGLILPIDLLVGMEVACTMYAFYALFRRGGL